MHLLLYTYQRSCIQRGHSSTKISPILARNWPSQKTRYIRLYHVDIHIDNIHRSSDQPRKSPERTAKTEKGLKWSDQDAPASERLAIGNEPTIVYDAISKLSAIAHLSFPTPTLKSSLSIARPIRTVPTIMVRFKTHAC